MSEKVYDTLVFGTGYLAIGYAATHKDTLIVERAEYADKYFSGAYRVGSGWDYLPVNEKAKELRVLYESYKILDSGVADVASAEPVFSKFIKELPINFLLLCDVVSVEKKDGFSAVTLYHNGGIETVLTKRILDTRPSSSAVKFQNLLVFFDGEGLEDTVKTAFGKAAFVSNGLRAGEKFVSVPVKMGESVTDLRIRIVDTWREKISPIGARISTFAAQFAFVDPVRTETIGENYIRVSESTFDNGFSAFDYGAALSIGGDAE